MSSFGANYRQLLVCDVTEYYTEVHLHCFLRKRYSSLSMYRKQKQSPLEILKMADVQGVTASVYGTC
jgi:hypothetical protein